MLLGRLTALPALVLLTFLLTGFPFLLFGYFRPIPVVVGWVALTALVVPYAWRRIPSVTGAGIWGTTSVGLAKPTPRWTLWSLVAVSVAFGVFNEIFHSQFIIDEYDAASYMQFAQAISAHGTTIIPENPQFFGGHPPSIVYSSAAFFAVGNHLVPQFMAGLPMVLSLGFWVGGVRTAVFVAPVLGALAVFTFGGLVARLVGPRWAPFAALAIAVTVPMQYVSRSSWSESLAFILLIAGLALWIDSQRADLGPADAGRWRDDWRSHVRSPSHVLAGIAGLLFGIAFLVRIDSPADIALIIPFCGLLILRRQRQAAPLIAGLVVGTAYGVLNGTLLTFPYWVLNASSLVPLTAGLVVLLIGTTAAVLWLRRRGSELRNPPGPRLVRAMTILPFAVVAIFLILPYVDHSPDLMQYARVISLHWVYWYTGAATIVFATVAFAMLGRRAVKGEAPVWVLPLLVFGCATVVFLYRVAITPHQPYASRRLVPAVLPGLILVAVWLASWLARRSRVLHLVNVPDSLRHSPRIAVIALCAAGIALPPLVGNVAGLAFRRTFVGETTAMNRICAGIPAGKSVLFIDNLYYGWFGGAIRDTCNVPVAGAHTTHPDGVMPDIGNTIEPATMIAAVKAIEGSGHQPFVLAPRPADFASLNKQFGNGTVKLLITFETNDDEHIYLGTPRGTASERFTLYSWEPSQ